MFNFIDESPLLIVCILILIIALIHRPDTITVSLEWIYL